MKDKDKIIELYENLQKDIRHLPIWDKAKKVDEFADRILAIQEEEAKDRVSYAWAFLEEEESKVEGGVITYYKDSIAVKALRIAAGLEPPTK